MSYKFSFADNEIYSASDVNAITKRLVTSGIEDSFTDGVAYNVSKFNEAGKLLYTSGVVPESNLTLKVVAAEEGNILINPGMAFFDDGSVFEIEDGGEEMPYVTGAKNYVYLKNDLINKNISYPYCGVTEPTGDYVLLAEIDETGAIVDKRTFARGKLPGYQSVAGNVLVIDETVTNIAEISGRTLTGSAAFDIGSNNYEYILVYTPYTSPSNMYCLGIYDIANKTYRSFFGTDIDNSGRPNGAEYSDVKITSHTNSNHDVYTELTFEIAEGKLTVNYFRYDYQNTFYAGWTYPTKIKLFLF